MYNYQTDFTRLCRLIANRTRLTVLWALFDKDLCVEDIAAQSGISPQHASTLLSSMAVQNLLEAARKNRKVLYSPRRQEPLMKALQNEKKLETPHTTIIAQATSFTHERRIQIARTLAATPRTFEELINLTGLAPQAQTRHLRKLLRRGVVQETTGFYRLQKPSGPLSEFLLGSVLKVLQKERVMVFPV